jgi:hypothetical protein
VPPQAAPFLDSFVVVATGRHSRLSSPQLNVSATSSVTSPPLPPPGLAAAATSSSTFTATTSPLIRQQQTILSVSQPTLASSSAIGDPSARISTSTGVSGLSRSASTALRDDLPDSPRPRKRPRIQSSSDLAGSMKFENSTSTDVDDSLDVHHMNGNTSTTVKNGVVKEATNGVSSAFGTGAVRNGSRFNDRFFGHSRQEVTRLMIQALNDLGYT